MSPRGPHPWEEIAIRLERREFRVSFAQTILPGSEEQSHLSFSPHIKMNTFTPKMQEELEDLRNEIPRCIPEEYQEECLRTILNQKRLFNGGTSWEDWTPSFADHLHGTWVMTVASDIIGEGGNEWMIEWMNRNRMNELFFGKIASIRIVQNDNNCHFKVFPDSQDHLGEGHNEFLQKWH